MTVKGQRDRRINIERVEYEDTTMRDRKEKIIEKARFYFSPG
jgi:ribosomal protein L14E/L6E/L27E